MSWLITPSVKTPAIGGQISDVTISGITYRVHQFTQAGLNSFTAYTSIDLEYLIVAGGGGAGFRVNRSSGGGGGGGVLNNIGQSLLNIQTGNFTVNVGVGGVAGLSSAQVGFNGENSSVFGFTATGGGGGASPTTGTASRGNNGGSGGGGGTPASVPVSGQGQSGGIGFWSPGIGTSAGGGGGGFSTSGADGASNVPGVGGDGLLVSFTGSNFYVSGGGGAGSTVVAVESRRNVSPKPPFP
jgi:hypothetical protein